MVKIGEAVTDNSNNRFRFEGRVRRGIQGINRNYQLNRSDDRYYTRN